MTAAVSQSQCHRPAVTISPSKNYCHDPAVTFPSVTPSVTMALRRTAYSSPTHCTDLAAAVGYLPTYTPVPDISTSGEMYQKFQSWALRNYGDSGKTKTVTRRKYNRIVRILTGEEPATTENSKFRFWVKGKGFRLGPVTPAGEHRILYVPTKMSLVSGNFVLFLFF